MKTKNKEGKIKRHYLIGKTLKHDVFSLHKKINEIIDTLMDYLYYKL